MLRFRPSKSLNFPPPPPHRISAQCCLSLVFSRHLVDTVVCICPPPQLTSISFCASCTSLFFTFPSSGCPRLNTCNRLDWTEAPPPPFFPPPFYRAVAFPLYSPTSLTRLPHPLSLFFRRPALPRTPRCACLTKPPPTTPPPTSRPPFFSLSFPPTIAAWVVGEVLLAQKAFRRRTPHSTPRPPGARIVHAAQRVLHSTTRSCAHEPIPSARLPTGHCRSARRGAARSTAAPPPPPGPRGGWTHSALTRERG